MKYAENFVAMNIVKYTGLRSGTEVKFRGLVWFVVLVLGVRYNYAVAVGEKKKDKGLIVEIFYCSFKTQFNIFKSLCITTNLETYESTKACQYSFVI